MVVFSPLLLAQPPGQPPAYEQVFQTIVELDKTLDAARCIPGTPITAHVLAKLRLPNGMEISPSTRVTGHVLSANRATAAQQSTLTIVLDHLEVRKGQDRLMHASVIALAPAPDYLHPSSSSEPLDRGSPGVGVGATASSAPPSQNPLATGEAVSAPVASSLSRSMPENRGATRFQHNGLPGVDLNTNLLALNSGVITAVRNQVVLPAGTRVTLLIAVRSADYKAP